MVEPLPRRLPCLARVAQQPLQRDSIGHSCGPTLHPQSLRHPSIVRFLCYLESVEMLAAQLCPTLCDPMDCSLPGPSIHGILQARKEYWSELPFPSPRDLSAPGIEPGSPTLHCRHILYQLCYQGNLCYLGWMQMASNPSFSQLPMW